MSVLAMMVTVTGLVLGMRENVRTTIKGEPFYYDLVIEPMYDSNSNVIGISCASIEINEQTYKLNTKNR